MMMGMPKLNLTQTIKAVPEFIDMSWQSCYGETLATIDHACGLKSCINLRHLRELDLDHNRKFGDPRKLNTEKGN